MYAWNKNSVVGNQALQLKFKNPTKLNQARLTKEHKGNDTGYCRGDFHELNIIPYFNTIKEKLPSI